MRKKFVTAILPLTAGLAIVGAGFSAWVFTETNVSPLAANGTVNITDLYTPNATLYWCDSTGNNASSSAQTFTITLDQGGVGNSDNSVGITTDPANIHFYIGYTESSDFDISFEYTFTVDADQSLSTYIECTSTVTTSTAISNGNASDNKTDVVDLSLNFQYLDKPTSEEEYGTLSDAISTSNTFNLTLSVTASVTDASN